MTGLRLVAAGDIALGGGLAGLTPDQLAARVDGVRHLFAGADLALACLDCAVGTQGRPPRPEEYLVAGPVENLALLRALRLDAVSLANNHSTDRGMEALERAIAALRAVGLAAVGAGRDRAAAEAPAVLERGGLRVGVLAFASAHPWVGAIPALAIPAETGTAGVAPLVPERVEAAVAALAGAVDAVVLCLHWGKEFVGLPPPQHVAQARRFVDAGARIVLGTHPHVVQPVETHGPGVICYSLGNFLYPDDPAQGLAFVGDRRESLVVAIRLEAGAAHLESVTPVAYDDALAVRPLDGHRAGAVRAALAATAAVLGTGAHEEAWRAAVRRCEWRRLRRVLREEVVAAGWRGGAGRLLRLGRKNLVSVARSLGEILALGRSRHG